MCSLRKQFLSFSVYQITRLISLSMFPGREMNVKVLESGKLKLEL